MSKLEKKPSEGRRVSFDNVISLEAARKDRLYNHMDSFEEGVKRTRTLSYLAGTYTAEELEARRSIVRKSSKEKRRALLTSAVTVLGAAALALSVSLISDDKKALSPAIVCEDDTINVTPGVDGAPNTSWDIANKIVAGGNKNPDAVVDVIARLNPGVDPSLITPRTTLKIPALCRVNSGE